MTKCFTGDFYGVIVEIGDIKFTVIESFIAEATRVPRIGEKWFKNKGIEKEY